MQRILMEEATASVSTNDLNRENEDAEYVLFISILNFFYSFLTIKTIYSECHANGEQTGNRLRKTSASILSGSSSSSSNPENYVSRIQNATTNVMGKISGLGRGVSGFGGMAGGIANKFLNNL